MKLTNNEQQSLSIAVFLATDNYNHNRYPGKLSISTTGLIKPPRMIILNDRIITLQEVEPKETEMDIALNIPSRVGSAIHTAIEDAWKNSHTQALTDLGYPSAMIKRVVINPTPEALILKPNIIPVYMEQRVSKEIDGYIIDGQYDFVGEGTLEDFKTTGTYGYVKNNPHDDELKILQGSIYRWLNPEIVTSDHMLIQYIFTDWSKLESIKQAKRGYPVSRIVAKKFILKSIIETESWIRQRLQLLKSLKHTKESELPLCTKEELWADKTIYSYYKNPASTKRSTKNFNANEYHLANERLLKDGNVGIIREKKGKVKRCNYCNCIDICSQAQSLIANRQLA